MNHKHCRPLTDRQNVLHVFAKHTKSQRDARALPDLNSDSSRAKKTARFGSTCKVKRLKTRKERCRMRGESGQDIHALCCHQSRRENKMEHSHSGSHNHPLHRPSKENTFTMADHGPEPCIITDGRLIGHRGLFNREVKSVDIERLVSDKMKTKLHGLEAAGGHRGGSENSRAALPSCETLSAAPGLADCSASNLAEEAWMQEKAEGTHPGEKAVMSVDCPCRARARTQTSGESQENVVQSKTLIQVCMGNNTSDNVSQSDANVNNSTASCTTPLQSAGHLRGVGVLPSFNSEPELPSSSASSRVQSVRQRERPHSQTQKGDHESPGSAAAERPVEQHADSRGRERGNVCAPQQPSKDCRPLKCHAQSWKPDLPLTLPSATTGAQGYADAEDRLQRRAGDCAAMAARLCGAAQLPALCRRNLLAESREALLQALQGRHGPRLAENLLRLGRRVSGSAAGPEIHGAALRRDSESDIQASGCRENMAGLEQSRPSAHALASNSRRRKQLFPRKVEPRLPEPQHNETAMQWNGSVIVELAGEPSGGFTKTYSPPLVMDFLPSLSSSPPSFMSFAWGVHTRQQLPQDRPFRDGRATGAGERMQDSGYSPEMCFFSQTKNLENARPPFSQHSAFLIEETERDRWLRRPADSEISNFNATSPPPLHHPHHIYLQTHSSIHQPPPILGSYSSDRIYYPRYDKQERALSPPLPLLPSFPSPDPWSFPRMRLY
ncbi:uncharacterized protein si:dkey-250k15.4 [Anguilla anguilla]|uniref:uncharacterized protein si:dkey-250k15.4 n=1 Tax=Anguilla anguilla TaxID=7936 RepID=UPI0015AEF99C|nr:uncharacterized protein si:dkey-250k15.4 [Anguilla anguilla]